MVKKLIKPGIIVVLVIVLTFSTVGIVQPGHVGIFMTLGSVSDRVKDEGVYLKIPFIQSVKQMDVRTKKVEWIKDGQDISAMSKDMLDVYIKAAVTYHPVQSQGANIYKTLGQDYSENIITPLTVNVIKTCLGKYNVSEIIQNREKITSNIEQTLRSQFQKYYMVLEFLSIINIDFRPEFKDAIEQREIAVKQVETQKYTLEKQALEAQQQVKKAEAEKQSKIMAAEAEEEFNKRVSNNISDELLKYKALQVQEKAIEKWDGSYPQVVAGGQSIPMIQLPQNSKQDKPHDTK